ncbi:hypothetical protein FB451DRAFT_1185697 [Mycena latifolia]|nr:hypothetical protein FB451DRAFT_1185697 [Mycena latifolia]
MVSPRPRRSPAPVSATQILSGLARSPATLDDYPPHGAPYCNKKRHKSRLPQERYRAHGIAIGPSLLASSPRRLSPDATTSTCARFADPTTATPNAPWWASPLV